MLLSRRRPLRPRNRLRRRPRRLHQPHHEQREHQERDPVEAQHPDELRRVEDAYHEVELVTRRDGLAANAVRALFEDREGNIWIGMTGGLTRLSERKVTSLAEGEAVSSLAAPKDGSRSSVRANRSRRKPRRPPPTAARTATASST